MKLLQAKYIYPLVILSMFINILLQVAWLSQFFSEEKRRTKEDLENLVAVSAQNNLLATLDERLTGNPSLNQFFLSSEWREIWIGFDKATDPRFYKSINIYPYKDSTILELQFNFLRNSPIKRTAPKLSVGMGYSSRQMANLDNLSLNAFKQSISRALDSIGIRSNYFFSTHSYIDKRISRDPEHYDFYSKKYGYNTLHLRTAQLIVNSVNRLIWYKMRYYLISSILMVAVSAIAFYFIFKLMITRRLYADARVAFTSNMTHEIKTPIATIALALESISKYNLINEPEKLERYLNMGKQELQRLSHLVEKVLNLSQENDKPTLNPVFYDVQAGLSDVIRSMELPLKNASAICELIVSPEPCFIDGDAVHLSTVFYNLIENAIKYSIDPLKLIITCSCDNEWITISFEDNGPGIPERYQLKIFERFFRIPQPGHTHPVKGSGLGLNYVLSVIQSHHGAITLKSEEGVGSKFNIKLPAAKYES